MARRVTLFRVFDIAVTLHLSWVLCAALIGWNLAADVFPALSPNLDQLAYVEMAIAGTLGLFASIVAHELSHSLVARHFGVPIRVITLFIFGGMAELEEGPRTPKSEFFIAAAGPVASLVLAGLAFLGEILASAFDAPEFVAAVAWYLSFANLALALFNLVPAFPLDGGRILRAILWSWRGDLMWATVIACIGGSMIGGLLMVVGGLDMVTGDIVGGAWRLLIGFFLRAAAVASRDELSTRTLLAGASVAAAMNCAPVSVPRSMQLATFAGEIVPAHPHRSFPVTERGQLCGTLFLSSLSRVGKAARLSVRVREIMTPLKPVDLVSPDEDLIAVMRRMQRDRRPKLWVSDQGKLVGVLSQHDIRHLASARLAMDETRSSWIRYAALS